MTRSFLLSDRALFGDAASDPWGLAAPPAVTLARHVVIAGTRICTSRGMVAAEDLQSGDGVTDRSAGATPLLGLVRGTVARATLIRNPRLTPVLVGAGALGKSVPARDLMVHPLTRLVTTSDAPPRTVTELIGGHRIARVFPDGLSYVVLTLPAGADLQAEGVWLAPPQSDPVPSASAEEEAGAWTPVGLAAQRWRAQVPPFATAGRDPHAA